MVSDQRAAPTSAFHWRAARVPLGRRCQSPARGIPALRPLDVSNRSYSVSTFLKDVARTHTAEFVNWVLSRLPSGPDVEWTDVHLGLEELRRLIDPEDLESSERTRLVDAVLRHAKESSGLDAGGLQPLGVLLAWAAPSVDAIMPSVTTILLRASEEEFRRVVGALSEFGEPLVFGLPGRDDGLSLSMRVASAVEVSRGLEALLARRSARAL